MPIPKGFQSPSQVTARERVYSQLQRWVIDGTLEPGEKLNDGELAEALGVSRTPVREALQLLEVQGFVEMHRGRDTRVTRIEREDILKVYPPLAALQVLAGEIALPLIRSEQIELLRGINAEFARAVDQQQAFRAMEVDEQFHNVIIEVADNPYVASYISTLEMHIRRLKYVFLRQPEALARESVVEHAAIIEGFERKNMELVTRMLKQNWIRPMKELYALIGERCNSESWGAFDVAQVGSAKEQSNDRNVCVTPDDQSVLG